MKPIGDNPAETFQGLWDGLITSRRFAFACGQCLGRSLEPQEIFGGAAVGAYNTCGREEKELVLVDP